MVTEPKKPARSTLPTATTPQKTPLNVDDAGEAPLTVNDFTKTPPTATTPEKKPITANDFTKDADYSE